MHTRTPGWARAALYGLFGLLLGLILVRLLKDLVPGKAGVTISRNSEGFLILLAVCAWIDGARPRLLGRRAEWPVTLGAGVLLVVGGFLLRQAPWPSQVVTLNEALIGIGILVVYLQLPRPVSRWAYAVPALAVLAPLLWWGSAFTTDMAEAFGALVLVPLVVDLVDRGLLRGERARPARNVLWAVALLAFIWVIHLVTPKPPETTVQEITYYVQRATETFVAAAVILLYYATRRPVQSPANGATDPNTRPLAGAAATP